MHETFFCNELYFKKCHQVLLFWFSTLVLMKEMYNLISENLTKIFHSKIISTENQQPVEKITTPLH